MGKPLNMAKIRHAKFILLLFGLSSYLSYQQDQHVNLNFDEVSRTFRIKDQETKYFKLLINDVQYDPNADLILKVLSLEQEAGSNGDPDIFISKTHSRPNSPQTSDYQCSTYGKDTCSISSKNIKIGDTFNIGVKCSGGRCSFQIKPTLVKEIELEDGIELQKDLEAYQSQVFKFYIPESLAQKKDSQSRVQSVIITAAPFLPSPGGENLQLYASIKGDVTPKGAGRKGVPGWRKGQVMRLGEDYPEEWCTGCWVTILVDVTTSGKYHLLAKTNLATPLIHPSKRVDDIAFSGERLCYQYYVKNADTDLEVRVAPFSGLLSYNLTPQRIPIDHEDGSFKFAGQGSSSLVVSSRERKEAKTGLYYICVFAHLTSTFSLIVQEREANLTYHYLQDGYVETGEVQGNGNLTVYMYKVPPLDFETQDLSLEIQLTIISGETPQMAASVCQEWKDHGKCAQNLTQKSVFGGARSDFIKAKQVNQDLSLIIDHDEKKCSDIYKGECYYVIVIMGQSKSLEDFTKFQLSVVHTQQNYYTIQEGRLISDYVQLGTYRYYSFTLMEDPSATGVQFKLTTLHGDADLFVSRKHKYPNKVEYERSSVKSLDTLDQVTFSKDNDAPINATYYVAVYSLQYSTFTLLVTVDRGHGQQQAQNIPMLFEGIPVKGSIFNENGQEEYRIELKQTKGYEKALNIQVTNLEGKVNIYVNVNERANHDKKLFASDSGSLIIRPTDSNFVSEGTYYLIIKPQFNLWQLFYDNYYTYLISYTTEETSTYLSPKLPITGQNEARTSQYFRHFVSDFNQDFSLSMTVFSGQPQLYVSFTPANKLPNKDKYDLTSRAQTGLPSKAIYFSHQMLAKANPQCQESTTSQAGEPCAIFASIYCLEECRYSLRLTYENSGPQQLIVGMPQHSILKDGTFSYYYLIVRQNKIRDIYTVLDSLSGNADLYLGFQDNPQSKIPEEWEKPDMTSYSFKSTQFKGQDIIRLKPSDGIQACFNRYDLLKYGGERECALVIGVYAPTTHKQALSDPTNQTQIDEYSTRYTLVIYTDLLELQSQTPMNSYVEQNEYAYFLYESTCAECTLLVSLSTLEGTKGDPDLYISFGDQRMPTKESHDIKSSTFKSEIVTINKETKYFKEDKSKTMKGPLVIGVYGVKPTNFTLSITQQQYPLTPLEDNSVVKAVQEPYEIIYYLWYNQHKQKDFKVQLSLKSGGPADFYVSTFQEEDETQNLVSRLPKSKRDALWVVEDITPTSSLAQKELLIVNQERSYCDFCYYVVAVVTHERRAEYGVGIEVIDQANFNNSLLMKMGEVYHTSLKRDETKVFRFIIDEDSKIDIVQQVKSGIIQTTLANNPQGESPIDMFEGTKTKVLKQGEFQTQRMYYLVVKASVEAEFTLMLMQDRTVLHLSDGVPMTLRYTEPQDSSKYLVFSIPDGSYTLQFQLKSFAKGFYPKLYIKYYHDLESELKTLEFPPGGDPSFFICKNWDYKLGILNYYERFENIVGGKAGLVLNLFDASPNRDSLPHPLETSLTIATSSVLKLQGDQSVIGTLEHQQSFLIYQVDENVIKGEGSGGGYLMIEFASCLGDAEYVFIDNPRQLNLKDTKVKEVNAYSQHGRHYRFVQLPLQKLYLLVKTKHFEASKPLESDQKTDFWLRVRFNSNSHFKAIEYFPLDNGKLSYDFVEGNKELNLTWSDLYQANQGSYQKSPTHTFHIIATKDERAKLDSVCILSKEVGQHFVLASFQTNQSFYHFKNPIQGEKYYMNVVAQFQEQGSGKEGDLVPYMPVTVVVPGGVSAFSKLALLFYLVFGVGLAAAVIYYYRKTKVIEKQLEFEMADVRNVASVSYDASRERARQDRKERYQSLVGSSEDAESRLVSTGQF